MPINECELINYLDKYIAGRTVPVSQLKIKATFKNTISNLITMTKQLPIFFILIFAVGSLVSCQNNVQKQALDEREAILREKERLFASKEAEYRSLVKLRDSINKQKDSLKQIANWPDEIKGQWNSKIVCTASDCNDYVIGDVRNDIWEFAQDSTKLYVKVLNKNKLVRIYHANYANNQILLHYSTDSTAQKVVEMNVRLQEFQPNRIRGTRSVSIDRQCTAKFNVELVKSSNLR